MAYYGMVKDGVVLSVFSSEKPKEAFPDIAAFLEEIPPNVNCNWIKNEDGTFSEPVPPEAAVDTSILSIALQALVDAGVLTQEQMDRALGN